MEYPIPPHFQSNLLLSTVKTVKFIYIATSEFATQPKKIVFPNVTEEEDEEVEDEGQRTNRPQCLLDQLK